MYHVQAYTLTQATGYDITQPLFKHRQVCIMTSIFVGIDVSKDRFDVCVKDRKNRILMDGKKYEHTKEGFSKFDMDLVPFREFAKGQVFYGMEATGIYHKTLEYHLESKGCSLKVFNPLEINKKAKHRIRKTKTDRIDAELIAEALILNCATLRTAHTSNEICRLREYGRLRGRLKKKIRICKTQAHRDLDVLCRGYDRLFSDCLQPSSIAVIKLAFRKTRFLKATENEIFKALEPFYGSLKDAKEKAAKARYLFNKTEVPASMKEVCLVDLHLLIQEYELLSKQVKRIETAIEKLTSAQDTKILSIIGIGKMTGGLILGELGDVRRFKDRNAVVAFAGLDPSVSESGRSKHYGHISKRGSPVLRDALYMATLSARRYNPVCRVLYDRLKSRGKHHNVCMVAVARKLLLIAYSVLKNDQEFFIPKYLADTD